MEDIVTLISTIFGSTLVSSLVTYFTTKNRYKKEVEMLETDNFAKIIEQYQSIVNDFAKRHESSEQRYNDLVAKYNEILDCNLKLQSEIQTLKIQIRKIQRNGSNSFSSNFYRILFILFECKLFT